MRVHASGIWMNPAAFKIVEKFYFEDLSTDSFRFEAGECENNWLLSYFISDGGAGATLQTLDRARGQGHSGVTWPVMNCWPMADVPHDTLCFTLSGWWLLYSMTGLCPLCPHEVLMISSYCCLHLLHIASLAWSPQPPIMSALATNSGAQNTSTQLHLCVQMRGHWLDSAASKHSEGTGQFFLTFWGSHHELF